MKADCAVLTLSFRSLFGIDLAGFAEKAKTLEVCLE
jgi:hypothetical protein